MRIKVQDEKLVKAIKKLEGVEIILKTVEDARKAMRLILRKTEISKTKEYEGLKDMIISQAVEHPTSAVEYTGYLNASPALEATSYDGNITVYRVNNTTLKLFMIPADGWWELEKWDNTYTRWMKDNGTLFVYSPSESNYNLSFSSLSIYNNKTLQVFVNGYKVYENGITPSFTNITVPIYLNEGNNTILFSSPEGSIRPCDIKEFNSTDTRNLSFAIRNLSINITK